MKKAKSTTQVKTPITYYGGKQMMAKHILPLIPDHKIYTEAFIGGGAIYFLKPKAPLEVINDKNGEIVNFYAILKSDFKALKQLVSQTLHSRKTHQKAWLIYSNSEHFNKVERAWALWVLSTQGFAGQLAASWGYDAGTASKNCMAIKIQNKKYQFIEELSQRLENTTVECHDAIHVIKTRDSIDTFHYIDPPYYNSDLGHYGGYTIADYENLLKTLTSINGKFLLSSYPSEILTNYVTKNGWFQMQIKGVVNASKTTRKEKIEVLTSNYPI